MTLEEINSIISQAIVQNNLSIETANRLEVLLDDFSPNDDYLQETVEMLACYRPEGGGDVLGPKDIHNRLVEVAKYLKVRE